MTALGDVLARLEPLQQSAVALVYFEGRTPTEAAGLLSVEQVVVAAALAVAFRRIAPWVLATGEGDLTAFPPTTVGSEYRQVKDVRTEGAR